MKPALQQNVDSRFADSDGYLTGENIVMDGALHGLTPNREME